MKILKVTTVFIITATLCSFALMAGTSVNPDISADPVKNDYKPAAPSNDCPDITISGVAKDASNPHRLTITLEQDGAVLPYSIFRHNSPENIISQGTKIGETSDLSFNDLTQDIDTLIFYAVCDGNCGDSTCDSWEDWTDCLSDCHCGDSYCDKYREPDFEDSSNCPSDCYCGDMICDAQESVWSCSDCMACNCDGICEDFEEALGCDDCSPLGSTCNCDTVCDAGESVETCEDCNTPPSFCGDSNCDAGEDIFNCPGDCAVCGDMTCSPPVEDEFNCPGDCSVGPVCGNTICEVGEDPILCPEDCSGGGFCGDMTCDPGEDEFSCPQDCGGGPGGCNYNMICDVFEDMSCPDCW